MPLIWDFLLSGHDRQNGLWPSCSSISHSSAPCRSSGGKDLTAPIWPLKSSCSSTRLPSSVGKWPALLCDPQIEHSSPASAGISPDQSALGSSSSRHPAPLASRPSSTQVDLPETLRSSEDPRRDRSAGGSLGRGEPDVGLSPDPWAALSHGHRPSTWHRQASGTSSSVTASTLPPRDPDRRGANTDW
jgi:hypothetical protein